MKINVLSISYSGWMISKNHFRGEGRFSFLNAESVAHDVVTGHYSKDICWVPTMCQTFSGSWRFTSDSQMLSTLPVDLGGTQPNGPLLQWSLLKQKPGDKVFSLISCTECLWVAASWNSEGINWDLELIIKKLFICFASLGCCKLTYAKAVYVCRACVMSSMLRNAE